MRRREKGAKKQIKTMQTQIEALMKVQETQRTKLLPSSWGIM